MDKLGFTFYPKDWWTSETFFDLTPIQRYFYLESLFVMYLNEGKMKTQKTQLENRLRTQISNEDWESIISNFIIEDGFYTHPSVNKRLRKTLANRENGVKGGRPPKTQITQLENPKKPTLEREREREGEREIEIENKIETKESVGETSSPTHPKSSLKETLPGRERKFIDDLAPYVQTYGKEVVRKFFNYWSEKNKSGTKMKWELERTFEISKRLATWVQRDAQFNHNTKNQQDEYIPKISRTEWEAKNGSKYQGSDDPEA
jgi:hypothetical protein